MYIKRAARLLMIFCVMIMSFNSLAGELIKTSYTVKSGDNLIAILKNSYISSDDIHKLVYETKDSKKIQNLKVGQDITIYKESSGSLKKLILDIDNVNAYIVSQSDKENNFTVKKGKFKTNQIDQYLTGTVTYSVNKTLKDMGLTSSQRKEFKKMFGAKIDFKKIKKGSTFVAVFPEYFSGGKKVLTGDLVSVEVSYNNEKTQVFAFNDYKGEISFYLKNGEPISEGIKRDPLQSYTRVSSEFTLARMHPVLGKVRAHKGTDYAAKRNTPIYAAATGKIALKDTQRGYGNVIVINHADGYSTLYGHMNKFNKDIYSGKTVSKGDIIGYVGSTGISTGNHLHFEIRKDGKHLNPRKVKLPSGAKIAKNDVSKFKDFTKTHMDGINLAKILSKKEGKSRIAIRSKK